MHEKIASNDYVKQLEDRLRQRNAQLDKAEAALAVLTGTHKRPELFLELIEVAKELDLMYTCGGPDPIGRLKKIIREWREGPCGE
jgi:hypothetical protein